MFGPAMSPETSLGGRLHQVHTASREMVRVRQTDGRVVLCPAQEDLSLGFREPGARRFGFFQQVGVCHHDVLQIVWSL
jgi:hypothetical protein